MRLPWVYFKGEPTEFCRITSGGKVRKSGKGISKIITPFRTTVEIVDTSTIEKQYSFKETTKDNQEITIQGSFLYHVEDPEKVLENFNCAIDPRTKMFSTAGYKDISEPLVNAIRGAARKYVQKADLETILVSSEVLTQQVSREVLDSPTVTYLGLKVANLYVNQITPEPDIATALGATYREELLTKQQKAQYERRADGVEQEKAIKENELNNRIFLEKKREELIQLEAKNIEAEGASKAKVRQMEVDIFKGWDADQLKAYALLTLGSNAQKIETLTITPELLASIPKR